ncbi:4-alpha-glucanotransferase, partial [Klebsiella pneumoniae]|uniref:4-alpha-glucanotransferase n=2 Tax=Enterobacteriaceae TaxID=543 RepID=UPI001F069B92
GDFGDLKKMLASVGERGGAFIGLNPIHALYPANPESASPYSPSSRRWLNVIYIDVNALDDFKNSKEAQVWWKLETTQQLLKQA